LLPDEQSAQKVVERLFGRLMKQYQVRQNYTEYGYLKAYDMPPHTWLRKVLRALRAPRIVRNLVSKLKPLWRTDAEVVTEEGRPITLVFYRWTHCPSVVLPA
jgi:hypothetical protein